MTGSDQPRPSVEARLFTDPHLTGREIFAAVLAGFGSRPCGVGLPDRYPLSQPKDQDQ